MPVGIGAAGVQCRDGGRRLTQQQPADDQVANAHQEAHRSQSDFVDARGVFLRGHQVTGQRRRHALDVLEGLTQQGAFGLEASVAGLVGDELLDLAGHMGQRHALVANDLAEEEVLRLDGGGAFIERVDLGIPDVLLDRVVLQEARTAEGLQTLGEFGVGLLGADTFDDRQQQVIDLGRQLGFHALDRLGHRFVLEGRRVEIQRPQAFGVGLLCHQTATNVRVVGDGHPGRGLIGHLGQIRALYPRLGVVERVEVAGGQGGYCLGAHHHSGLLDHLEHLRNAVMNLADQPALGRYAVLTQGQFAGGGDFQAHLVLDVGDEGTVALAGFTGAEVEQVFRHCEQGESLSARAGAFGAGENQMEDVFEHVAGVRRGDESLHSVEVPRAVLLLDGLGPAGADVGTGIRLGQHHGGTPATFSRVHRPLLLLFGAQVVEDLGETGTAGVHPDRRIGAQDMLVQSPQQGLRDRYAAEFLNDADLVPAAVDERTHGCDEGFGQRHRVSLGVEYRRIAIAEGEGLRDRPLAQSRQLTEHLGRGVDVEVAVRSLAEGLVQAEYLEQVENLVANIALVVAHYSSLMRMPLPGWVLNSKLPTSNRYNYTVR